jgi:D-amino-acid dehydrogenase
MKVLVLGAGVAGVTAAWHFWRDGHEVTVVERNPGVALETSFANGGQLSYSYVAPLASPSVIPKIPPWLLRPDSPLQFRPELDPAQWRWCLAFLLACNRRTADLTTERLLRLAFYSRDLMRALMKEHALDFDYVQNGKLVVHTERESFESARRLMDFQRSLGCEQSALDARATVELEPALEAMAFNTAGASQPRRISGAIYTPSEDAGDCYKFCNELKRLMSNGPNPAAFRFGVGVDRLLASRGRLLGRSERRPRDLPLRHRRRAPARVARPVDGRGNEPGRARSRRVRDLGRNEHAVPSRAPGDTRADLSAQGL